MKLKKNKIYHQLNSQSPFFILTTAKIHCTAHNFNRKKCKFPNMINSITAAFKHVVIKDEVFPVSSSKQKLKYWLYKQNTHSHQVKSNQL